MNRTIKANLADMIKKVAVCKSNANCIGFMYEPKKPKKLDNMSMHRKGN